MRPCRSEAPTLDLVYREYAGYPVEFVGVNIWDRPSDAEEFARSFDIPYPTGVDEEGAIAIDYGVRGIPEKFFIDGQGGGSGRSSLVRSRPRRCAPLSIACWILTAGVP